MSDDQGKIVKEAVQAKPRVEEHAPAPETAVPTQLATPEPAQPKRTANSGFERVNFIEFTVIFEESEPGDAVYLIKSGNVEIRKGAKTTTPVTLARLGHGDIFGEMALFDDRPRMAQAIAVSEVEVIRISRYEFHNRLETVDPVMQTIMLYMVNRVRDMADEFIKRKDPGWGQWKK